MDDSRLKMIRKKEELTQAEFSELLDIGKTTYIRYEKGERSIPSDVLSKISQMGYSIDWLLTGQGSMHKPETKKAPDKDAGGIINDHDLDYNSKEEQVRQDIIDLLEQLKSEKEDIKAQKATLERLKFEIEQAKKEKTTMDSTYTDLLEKLDHLDKEDRAIIYKFITKLADT